MRRAAVLLLLVAVASAGCGPDGSQAGFEAIGPAAAEPAPTAETQPVHEPAPEPEPAADLCIVWIEGAELDELYRRANWASDLEPEMLDGWIRPLFTEVLAGLVAALPPGYEPLGVFFSAQIEALAAEPTATLPELEAQLIDQTGLELDELAELADRLFTEAEDACGPVEEVERVDLRHRDELPAHVRRVAGEVRADRLVECLTTASSLGTIETVLDREVLYGQSGETDPADGPDRLAALAEACGANPSEAAVFAWRVTDVDWRWAMLSDDLVVPAEPPLITIIEDPPDPGPTGQEPPAAEPVSPEPEVHGYPVEGLVADVLGTLGIVGGPAACLVEAGVYEPSQLWLDEPGVDPAVLKAQRTVLDEVAAACGFGPADVDGWLELAHQYVAEVSAGS